MRDAVMDVPYDVAVRGLEENLWDMYSTFGRGEGCALFDTPELLRFETPIPHVPYNSVMRTRLDDAAGTDARIGDVVDGYRRRGVPIVWVVHPSATPHDLPARLEARGLVEAEVCPGMVARLSQLPPAPEPPPGVTIEQLTSAARPDFFELIAWRYSLPAESGATLLSIMDVARFGEPECPTLGWVARRDGKVVSKAVAHLAAGVAGLYGVATRPEARGLGLARTLTCLAFQHARDLGYELGVLHSTPMAVNLYASLGFRHVADFRLYAVPGSLHL